MLSRLFFFIFCIVGSPLFSQLHEAYNAPVDIPLLLSGTFGELRNNHFHAGIDIKTQGKEGLPIKTVTKGYVSRIKISTSGYGKAIYINHPDGNTSVYAHLKKYSPKITAYIRKNQYQKQRFEIELFPEPNELLVTTNEIIGYTGNSGNSYGPHLHFELRETASQKPFNPLEKYYKVKDTQPPQITKLIGYPVGDNAVINASQRPTQLIFNRVNDSIYKANDVYAFGTIGFGISLFDRQDFSYNKNGIYQIDAELNGKRIHHISFDSFSFSDSKYINSLIDYRYLTHHRERIQQLFTHPNNKLDFIKETNNGAVQVHDSVQLAYQIKVSDIAGNNRYLLIPVKGKKQKIEIPKFPNPRGKIIKNDRDYLFELEKAQVYFPKGSVLEPTPIHISFTKDSLIIKNNKGYLVQPMTVKMNVDELQPGVFLGVQNNNNSLNFVTDNIENNQFKTKTKVLGVYAIGRDTISPTIKALENYDKRWLSDYRSLRFRIKDDQTGIKSYKGQINGEWVLFEFDKKNHEIVFFFNDYYKLAGTKHMLDLSVIDNVGNTTKQQIHFFRKE